MAIPVDFISLIKDIRGNLFDSATGLPINGKWFDIKGWHTSAGISATQVAADLAATVIAKDSATTSSATATTKATEANTYSANASASQAAALTSQQAAAASLASAVASASTASTKASESASSATLATNYSATAISASFSAGTSATASAASASTAATAATTATTSKNAAVIAETNTLGYSSAANISATNASNYAATASSAATTATTKAAEATTQRSLAASWAVAAEDLAVSDGINSGFSAYHYSRKAAAAVTALGGTTNFIGLGDAPAAYTGAGLKYLRVNAGATAVEFDALTKDDVGLANVDNTTDVNKPISSATQIALNTKSSQSALDTALTRVTTLESNTVGLSAQAAAGADPIRLLADREIYTSTTQVLATLQNAALTTFGLLKAALAAETIGTY